MSGKMTIDMMGFTQDDFIEGVTIEAAEKHCKEFSKSFHSKIT